MEIYYSTVLLLFGIIIYIMIVDDNVSIAINLISKSIVTQTNRLYWMIRFHPRNPITNYIMKRRYEKIALELYKELTAEKKSVNVESEI